MTKPGYSAALLLSMASMPMSGANPAPASCTMAAAGLMLGTAGIHFSLFAYARKRRQVPLTLHGLGNYMDKAI